MKAELDLKTCSTQRLRELFWTYEADIRKSRESPEGDVEADKLYGQARRHLTEVAEHLGDDDEVLEMDGKPWHHYL